MMGGLLGVRVLVAGSSKCRTGKVGILTRVVNHFKRIAIVTPGGRRSKVSVTISLKFGRVTRGGLKKN